MVVAAHPEVEGLDTCLPSVIDESTHDQGEGGITGTHPGQDLLQPRACLLPGR
jgi:hypothetical protein